MEKRPMTPSYDNMRLDICKKEYNIKLRKIFEPGKFIAWETLKSRHSNIKSTLAMEHCQGNNELKGQLLAAMNREFSEYERQNKELEDALTQKFLEALKHSVDIYHQFHQKVADDNLTAQLGFDVIHQNAKQAAFKHLEDEMPTTPLHLVEGTTKKLAEVIREKSKVFREQLEEHNLGQKYQAALMESFNIYEILLQKHLQSPAILRPPFDTVHNMAITSSFKHLRQNIPPTNPALVTLTESTLNKMIEAKCAEFRVLCKAEEEDTANAINLLLAAVLGQSFITDYSELTEKATGMYKEEMDKFMQTSFIPWEVLGRKHDKVVESCVRGLWGGIPPGKRAEFSEKIQIILQEKFAEYRSRNEKNENQLKEQAMALVSECVSIYKSNIRRFIENPLSDADGFEDIHRFSKDAAFKKFRESKFGTLDLFSKRLNGAIKQEESKALEKLNKMRPQTPRSARPSTPTTRQSFSIGQIAVEILKCSITDLPKPDIIINSVGTSFDLSKAKMSRVLLSHIGPKLQEECNQNTNPSTPNYRVTSGGTLSNRIIHYVLPSARYRIEESVMELLEKCDALDGVTVAMPALGTGNRQIPVKESARFLWTAINLLNRYRNPTTLNCIKVAAFDANVYQGFVEFFNSPPKFTGFPTHWGNVNRGECRCVPLNSELEEFKEVIAAFKASKPDIKEILQVERIQNPGLYKMYEGKREDMVDKVKSSFVERELFHGTTKATSDLIIQKYFNRTYAGKNATMYGQGVYFAKTSKYSHRYAIPEPERRMFLVKVLTGDFVLGNTDMKEPPAKNDGTSDAYHSLVNDVSDPTIFVVFNDASAYPKYRITYK